MTSSASFENHQGNGSLKLKIKFSRSKGFVSDFVNDSVPDAHVQKPLGSASSEPVTRSELLSSLQQECASSSTVDKFSTLNKLTYVDQSSTSDTAASPDCLDLRLNPEIINPNSPKDLDLGLKKIQPVPHPLLSSSDVNSSFRQEPSSHCPVLSCEEAEKCLCSDSKSKHAHQPGVNYRKVLQDLELLSAQRDEPGGRDNSLICRQKERHLTSAMETNGQFHKLAVAEPGSLTEEVSRGDPQFMEESSDGEPMSPFDIDCSLGLADEDFTFLSASQNPVQKQGRKREIKENPLYPWSVDGSTNSYIHYAECSPDHLKPTSSPDYQNQSKSDGKVTSTSVINNAQCSSSDHLLKTNTTCRGGDVQFCSVQPFDQGSCRGDTRDERADKNVKRVIIVDCGKRGGETLDSEINNNSHISQFSGSSTVVSNSDHQPRTLHLLQTAAFVAADAGQNCSVNLPSSVNTAPWSRHSPQILSLLTQRNGSKTNMKRKSHSLECRDRICTGSAVSDSQNPQAFNIKRTQSLGPISDSQYVQFSVSDRISSSVAFDMKQHSSSVTPCTSSNDPSVSLKTKTHSFVSSTSQQLHGKESYHEQVKSSLLVKLLANKDKVPNALHSAWSSAEQTSSSSAVDESMKQLAENPPSIVPLPVTLSETSPSCVVEAKSPPGRPLTCTMSYQLNHTIDELRKRISDEVLSEDGAGTSQDCGPSAQLCSPKNGSSFSCISKCKQRPKTQWCRCEKPEPCNIMTNKDLTCNFMVNQEQCRKCWRKLSRRWKRLKCGQKKQMILAWCRCNSPDPYFPEGTVSELCRKCMKRVSKKWRKRIAAKWCKCQTPVLSTFRLISNEGENTSDQFYSCKRCQKLISKEKEEVSMKGDLISPAPGGKMLPPMGPQPVMTDHNYSQSPFSPYAVPKMPIHINTSGMCQSQRERARELQDGGSHILHSHSSAVVQRKLSNLVYVFPPTAGATSGNSYIQSHGNSKSAGSLGLVEQNSGKSHLSLLETQNRSAVSHCAPATSGFGQTTSFELSFGSFTRAASHLTSDEHFDQENLSAPCPRNTDRTQSEKTSVSWETNTCPSWLQGISQELLQPCYVVMEKLQDESVLDYSSGEHAYPCSVACRQHSLNILCKLGELQECGHSLECKHTFDKCNGKRVSVWNRKRDYFRQNKTMVGYKEFRQKEIEKRKMKRQQSLGDTEVQNTVSTAGFFPLSAISANGSTNFRISSHNGVCVQQLSGSCTVPHCSFQQNSDRLQHDTSETESVENTSVAQIVPVVLSSERAQQKVNGRKGDESECLQSAAMHSEQGKQMSVIREGNSTWSKRSQFNVKYYVFSCQNRAFIVPLIQNKRSAKAVQHLDEEDLGYIKAVISQLLLEKDSCARHLKYPDSLRHKGSHRTICQHASKKAFVAPTLGDEGLDIEGLKSLISDRDFSRLVPRNTRTSKSKYLQEIGEKVHMYLTGGSEETPEWIKDVAKSIVLRHRNRVKNKKRLKPSKDVSIEIDYAEEEELVDVGEEGMLSPSHESVRDSDFCATGSSRTLCETKIANQSNNDHQCLVQEVDHMSHPTGSYVVAEAFEQEEKKPLVQNITETFNSVSEVDGSIPMPGQQIMIPLPESCSYGQNTDEKSAPPPISSSSDSVQQQYVSESVSEDQLDKKPLLGELLAATLFPLSSPSEEGRDNRDHSQSEQVQDLTLSRTSQPSKEQLCSWPLAVVKEEPPDDDYSHAWPDQDQTEGVGPYIAGHSAQEFHTIPFISNSTFGKDAVEIEDEEGSVTSNVDQQSSVSSTADVHTAVKVEPFDAEYSGGISAPLVTCVASGELAAVLAKSDHNETFSMEDNCGSLYSEVVEELNHSQVLPQIISVAYGEAVIHEDDVHADNMITSIVEVSMCRDQTDTDCMPHNVSQPDEKEKSLGREDRKDTVTLGEGVARSAESVCKLLSTNDTGIVDSSEQKHVINMSKSDGVPQISALTFGEAAKLWETGDDGCLSDSTEMFQSPDSTFTASTCQPEVLPVERCMVYGDVVAQGVEKAHLLGQQLENADGHHAISQEDFTEEYSEDLYDDGYYEEDENVETELKPVVGEGQLLAIPIVFPPHESNHSEVRDEHTSDIAQIHVGIDLSIVKQEPQETDTSVASVNAFSCVNSIQAGSEDGSNILLNHEPVDVNCVEVNSLFPSILDVRSLAVTKLPPDRREGWFHASISTEPAEESQDSLVGASSSDATLLESQTGDVYVAWKNSALSTPVANVTSLETEPDSRLCPNAVLRTAQNLKSLDSNITKNDASPSEVDFDVNCAASQVPQLEAGAGIQQCGKEKVITQQELKTCLKSDLSKTKSKKRKASRKRKRQQQMSVKSVATVVDSLVRLESIPSNFSASQDRSPTTKVSEHESKNGTSNREVVSKSQMMSCVASSKIVFATESKVISSDRKSSKQNILNAESVLAVRDTPSLKIRILPSTTNVLPAGRPDSANSDLIQFKSDIESANQDTLPSSCDRIQVGEGICVDALANEEYRHSSRTMQGIAERIPLKQNMQSCIKDGQSVAKCISQKNDTSPVSNGIAPRDTKISPSNKDTPDLSNVPANGRALHMAAADDTHEKQDFVGEIFSTDFLNTHKNLSAVVAYGQKNSALPCVREYPSASSDDCHTKSPPHEVVCESSKYASSAQSSDLQEHLNRNSLTIKMIDQAYPVDQRKTCVVTPETVLLETKDFYTCSEIPGCEKTEEIAEGTPNRANTLKIKTSKSRKSAHVKCKGRKRAYSRFGKTAVCSTSVSRMTYSAPEIDSDTVSMVSTTNDTIQSSASSSCGLSSERGISVLTPRHTPSSKSSTMCLSEIRDVPVDSRKSDFLNTDSNGMKEPSLVSLDSAMKNDLEKKSVEVCRKESSNSDVASSQQLVKSLQNSPQRPQDCTTIATSKVNMLDESVHYVSQISEGKGKQGRTCLVLRKKRPAQSSTLPSSSISVPSKDSVIDCFRSPDVCDDSQTEQLKEFSVPVKKLKEDTSCSISISTMEGQTDVEVPVTKGQKRKTDDMTHEKKNDRDYKATKSERSIFSDMSAVLSSIATPSKSVTMTLSKPCPPMAASGLTKVVSEAAVKVAEKGFDKNLFARLRASFVSVTDSTVATKSKDPENKPPSVESSLLPQNARERSFFDCLPQGFVDAWKKK